MNLKKIDTVASVATVLISIAAAAVSCWAAYTANHTAQLAYRPYIVAVPFLDQSGHQFGLYLSNPGLGPAVLKDISVTTNGKSYSGLGRSKWSEFIRDKGMPAECFRKAWPPVGTVLKAGGESPLLVLSDAAPPDCVGEMTKLLGGDDIRVHIEYGSIYDDRYSFDGSVPFNDDDAERAAALYRQIDTLRAELRNLQSQLGAHASEPLVTHQNQ